MGLWRRARAAYRALTREQFETLGLLDAPTSSGVTVTQQNAEGVTAYHNGITVISGTVAMLDRFVYKKVGEDDDRERALSHPAQKVIHDAPNPRMTPFVFWETLTSHAIGWGNGYAEIEFDRALRPIAMWPIPPDEIRPVCREVVLPNGFKATDFHYVYRGAQRIEAEDIFHVPGRGFDGLKGYSPVALFRQALGLSIAMERFGSSFFGNGTWAGVALEHPKNLSKEAQDRLVASVENMHKGSEKAHRLIILEEGMKASRPITIDPDDAQFLESRQFGIEEVARILNISPHKLKHKIGERPGGNLEQSQIDYMTDTVMPWTTRIEQECDRKLIAPSQRGTLYVEHQYAKMLKADTATRLQSQKAYLDMGVLTPEQIARQENLPKPKPKEPPLALLAPAAVPAMDAPMPAPEPQPAPRSVSRSDLIVSFRAMLLDVVGRFARREAEKARAAAKKGQAAFGPWVEAFYTGDEGGVYRDCLAPALAFGMAALGSEGDAREVAGGFARAYMERSRAELQELPARDVGQAVPRLLKRWETARTAEVVEEIIAAVAAEEKVNAA